MEKAIRVFHSFSEADAAEAAEDRSMTPEQRVAMVFELCSSRCKQASH